MNEENLIRHQIERLGVTVVLDDGEWESVPFKALISSLWHKKSSTFENKYFELGGVLNEYYLYIGSFNHDITQLSNNAVLISNGEKYEFKHREGVRVGDKLLYYTGVLRKLREEENEY